MSPYYEQDGIVIYHGDCRDVLPLLDRGSVDAVMTDPPFSVPVAYQAADGIHPRSWGDLLVMEPFFTEVFKKARVATKQDSQVYVCCDGNTYPVFYRVAYSQWPQSHLLVWYKPSGRRGRGWMHAHELLLHCRNGETTYSSGFRQDVIGIMPVRTLDREHPAEKPGQLWAFVGDGFPSHYRTVLDPFLGGGSVLAWAKHQGLRAIGIEIEERYCEIAAKRLAQGALNLEMGA